MTQLADTSWPVFLGLTILVMGFAAAMTGRALAESWRPMWQAVAYTLLLGGVDRFLAFSLFDKSLLSPAGYAFDTLFLMVIALASFRATRTNRMVRQYPWLYQRAGPFNWRQRSSGRITVE